MIGVEQGPAFAAQAAQAALLATFCLLVALAVPRIGLGTGFLVALACALLVQAASFRRR